MAASNNNFRSDSSSCSSSPAAWSVDDVISWAQSTHLSANTVAALLENEVDGSTLVTLTKAELQSELEITSLPARRYLWELIKSLKGANETQDYSAAIEIHREEIQMLSNNSTMTTSSPAGAVNHFQEGAEVLQQDGPDASSGGVAQRRTSQTILHQDPASLSAVVNELVTDAQRQRQIIDDRLLAYQLQRGMKLGQQVYEDVELARQEQDRLNQLLQQEETDRVYAESLASGREQRELAARRRREEQEQQQNAMAAAAAMSSAAKRTSEQSDDQDGSVSTASAAATSSFAVNRQISSLFGLCVQTCIENKVNVADAFRTGKIKPMIIPTVYTVSDDDDDDDDDLKQSWGDRKRPATVNKYKSHMTSHDLPFVEKCSVCFEENIRAYTLACSHSQCKRCTRKLFRAALRDNTLLPLRCCEVPIDMNIAYDLLTTEEAALILQRTEEIEAVNKMYCPSCSRFLNLDLIDTTFSIDLLCGCGTALCIACKTSSHPGLTCEQNQSVRTGSDDLILKLKQEQGWKQCPGCSMIIELRSGCNHMTCSNCRHEFCYRCLSAWNGRTAQCSSGQCELWDEDRLLEAGEARVQQEEAAGGGFAMPEPVRRERLRIAVEGLRHNEVCDHDWVRSYGYFGDCPNCDFTMHYYGMECVSDCGSIVCYTCAHHRIPQRGWR